MKKLITLIALLCVLPVTLAACGKDKSREDSSDLTHTCAPHEDVGAACIDKTPKRVIAFHNKYSNVALACDGFGHRLFVTTNKKIVVLTDPTCPGYVKQPPQAASAP